MAQNYTLGRGELHFAPYLTGTETPDGERYLGNTPEFNLTIEQETLDHFSSDRGIREKDDSVPLQVNRTGTLTTDNIDPSNVALFFFGSVADVAIAAATVTAEAHNAVKQGLTYQLGTSALTPSGVRGLDVHTTGTPDINIIVTDDTTPTPVEFDEGTDYTIDMALGRLYIVPGGAITDGDNLLVTYKTKTSTRKRIISGSTPIVGALRYIARNPKGEQIDYYMPKVSISPNGDYALKSDEWQTIPFTIDIQKKGDLEAIYADGRPAFS